MSLAFNLKELTKRFGANSIADKARSNWYFITTGQLSAMGKLQCKWMWWLTKIIDIAPL